MNLLHPSVCAMGAWGHNKRCRYTNGFVCEDCGTWVPDSDSTWYFTNRFGNRQDRSLHYGRIREEEAT